MSALVPSHLEIPSHHAGDLFFAPLNRIPGSLVEPKPLLVPYKNEVGLPFETTLP